MKAGALASNGKSELGLELRVRGWAAWGVVDWLIAVQAKFLASGDN